MYRSQLRPSCTVSAWAIALLLPAGCFVPDDAKPAVGYSLAVANQHNHRGMVQNERGVLQPSMSTSLPVKSGGNLDLIIWGNMDLSDSTGNAWFPNGHAGRFTQIDFVPSYSKRLGEGLDFEIGIHNYNLPNGLEFPFGERGATSELFAKLSAELLGAVVELDVRWDYDEVEDVYLQAGVTENFPIEKDKLWIWTGAWVGYSGKEMSFWNYGLRESGISDARATIALAYQYTEKTSLELSLNGSTILDSALKDWFGLLGIEKNNLWLSASVTYDF